MVGIVYLRVLNEYSILVLILCILLIVVCFILQHELIPNPKTFPSGIKAVADYVHERGLKFGIYSDAG